MAEEKAEEMTEDIKADTSDQTATTAAECAKTKKTKKKKEEAGTAWWEYALIVAVLSYKIYTPLPEDIEDRYPRSGLLFMQKAVFKVGHYIRIISPATEISYLRGATNGIAGMLHFDVEGVNVATHDLNNFKLYVFTPPNAKASNPGIYYIHGGGWLFGSFPLYSTYLQNMAVETGAVVVAPDYRLSPDAAFPAPFDDCMEGVAHLFKHAAELKIDPANVVLSGDSTGATMALSISLTLSEKQFKSVSLLNPATQNLLWTMPSQQVSQYFTLNTLQMAWAWSNYVNGENGQKHREYVKGGAYLQAKKKHKAQFKLVDPFEYFPESELKNADGKNWNPPAGDFMAQEIPDWMPQSTKKMIDYRVAPLFTSDVLVAAAGETHFIVSEYDILRDEGMMMAKRMEKAGVKVTSKILKGAFHCEFTMSKYFTGFNMMVPSADANTKIVFDHLKSLLSK